MATSAVTVDDLPDDVLALIFSQLPLASRTRAVFVSKRWRDVSHDPILWRVMLLHEAPLLLYTQQQLQKIFSAAMLVSVQELHLARPALDTALKLQAFVGCPSLRVIHIEEAPILCADITSIVRTCPSLHTLDLRYCSDPTGAEKDQLDFSQAHELRVLHLECVTWLTDLLTDVLTNLCTAPCASHLTTVILIHANTAAANTYKFEDQWNPFTSIREWIVDIPTYPHTVEEMMMVRGHQLLSYGVRTQSLDARALVNAPDLRQLQFFGEKMENDTELARLTKLKRVALSTSNWNENTHGLASLRCVLPQLEAFQTALDSSNTSQNVDGFIDLLSPDLLYASFENCAHFNDADCEKLAKRCPKLRVLRLGSARGSGMQDDITDKGLLALASELHELRELFLGALSHPTAAGYRRLLEANPELRVLELVWDKTFTNTCMNAAFKSCHKLHTLICDGVSGVSEDYFNTGRSTFVENARKQVYRVEWKSGDDRALNSRFDVANKLRTGSNVNMKLHMFSFDTDSILEPL